MTKVKCNNFSTSFHDGLIMLCHVVLLLYMYINKMMLHNIYAPGLIDQEVILFLVMSVCLSKKLYLDLNTDDLSVPLMALCSFRHSICFFQYDFFDTVSCIFLFRQKDEMFFSDTPRIIQMTRILLEEGKNMT